MLTKWEDLRTKGSDMGFTTLTSTGLTLYARCTNMQNEKLADVKKIEKYLTDINLVAIVAAYEWI